MKKISFLLIALFATTFLFAQEPDTNYRHWAAEVEFGIVDVASETAKTTNNLYHIGAGVNYALSPKFYVGATASFDRLAMIDFNKLDVNSDLYKIGAMAYANMSNILDLKRKRFVLLVRAGGGFNYLDADNGHEEQFWNVSAGARGVYRIGDRLGIYLDFGKNYNFNDKTLVGDGVVTVGGVKSTHSVGSIGLNFFFGGGKNTQGKGKGKKHGYFYVKQKVDPVVNNYYQQDSIIVREECKCDHEQLMGSFAPGGPNHVCAPMLERSVYFDHGKHTIKDSDHAANEAIESIYRALVSNPDSKVELTAFASPTGSDSSKVSNARNLDLSKDRLQTVVDYLVALDSKNEHNIANRIISNVEPFGAKGKDMNLKDKKVHRFARKVLATMVYSNK